MDENSILYFKIGIVWRVSVQDFIYLLLTLYKLYNGKQFEIRGEAGKQQI